MNHYILSAALTSASTGALALLALLSQPRDRLHQLFGAYFFSIALWSFCVTVSPQVPQLSPLLEFAWSRLLHLGAIFIPVFLFHVAWRYTQPPRGTVGLKLAYGGAILFNLVNFFTPYFTDVTAYRVQYAYPHPVAPLYPVFVVFLYVFVLWAFLLLWRRIPQLPATQAQGVRLFLLGSALGYLGAIDNFLIMIDVRLFPWYPFGLYLAVVYAIMSTIAVVRYQLLKER